MIRRAKPEDTQRILDYVRPHVSECMYLYIDIKKYGVEDEFLKAWVDEKDGELSLAIMKYHTGIVLYTDDENWDAQAVADLIVEENVNSVTARKELIEKLHEILADKYDDEYGLVYILSKLPVVDIDAEIEVAKPEDTLEIAYLVTMDEGIGAHYEIEDFANQLKERMLTNFGRSYIIRKDGKIIGHIASYAECDGFATISGLIVHPDYRTGLYGAALEEKIMSDLIAEGFTVYSTVVTKLRKQLLKATGNELAAEYGKLVKKN